MTVAESRAESGEVILRLRNIGKRFGTFAAVDDVSVDVRRGEILTLLGPSGCGKTTTLRMVVGLERVSSGVIEFQGKTVDGGPKGPFEPPNRRSMGMVFQSYAIWPHMSVFENVAYPLRVRRVNRKATVEQVNRALDLVGLAGFGDRPGTRLSGGQMQRVAVARALVFQPEILLMDEPFSNLDAKLRDQMRAEVKVLQRRLGITVLFVTHDQTEALSLSDRIAVMNHGHMEQIGPPQILYADPETAAVRDFLGRTIGLPGTLAGRGPDGCRVTLRDGTVLSVTGGERGGRVEAGGSCLVTIRPEFVSVQPHTGVDRPPNSVSGEIEALLFMGEHYEASALTPVTDKMLISLSTAGSWHERQKVEITFPANRLQLWPE